MSHRRLTWSALVTLVLLVAGALGAGAQGAPLVDGDRIRVDWRDRTSNSADGRYREGSADSIVFITREGTRLAVPRSSVQRLQVALGVRNRSREYALGVGLAGGIVGAAVGASSAKKDQTLIGESYATLGDPTTNGIIGALAGGLVGAFVGTWIGKSKTTDRWQDVNLSAFKVSLRVR